MVNTADVPRIVVAAPASGHGKTTVATGLLAALRARGLAVSGHKVGPDYIDPGYHALASGRPGRNLDPVLCGEELIAPLFLHGATGAGVAVIEGVMGLFDGQGTTSHGSAAHVARLLDAPVVLVVDVAAQARSVAAVVAGFASYDPRIRVGGVVLNRVASPRHEEIVRTALADLGVRVLGAIRTTDAVTTPSRHLGLVPAAERADEAVTLVERLGAVVADAVDLDAVLTVARTAGTLTAQPWSPPEVRVADRPTVAIAGGAAFTFSYAETAELLTAAGADVVSFDPLHDKELPERTAALVIGGGFPEMYADDLSANEPLRTAVAELAATGAPVAAECAGLLYLAEELDGKPMCGVLDATARMTEKLSLGYGEATAATGSVLADAGTTVRAHEFHRTAIEPAHSVPPAWRFGGRQEGFVRGNVHASYLHLHWAGIPAVAERVVRAAAAYQEAVA
ncbi:MAG: cobyrinate a,c-diamide synthase [Streptosporangiales bacterium]|nr:cobyrinate a,c-diamide synthase [Streptosporangiales bacterium]